jgi:hypothetical protein
VVAVFGDANNIGGPDVQSAGYAVIVDVTPGKGAGAIIAAFPLPLRVALEALPFAIRLDRFLMVFAFLVSLREKEKKRSGREGDWMCG